VCNWCGSWSCTRRYDLVPSVGHYRLNSGVSRVVTVLVGPDLGHDRAIVREVDHAIELTTTSDDFVTGYIRAINLEQIRGTRLLPQNLRFDCLAQAANSRSWNEIGELTDGGI